MYLASSLWTTVSHLQHYWHSELSPSSPFFGLGPALGLSSALQEVYWPPWSLRTDQMHPLLPTTSSAPLAQLRWWKTSPDVAAGVKYSWHSQGEFRSPALSLWLAMLLEDTLPYFPLRVSRFNHQLGQSNSSLFCRIYTGEVGGGRTKDRRRCFPTPASRLFISPHMTTAVNGTSIAQIKMKSKAAFHILE